MKTFTASLGLAVALGVALYGVPSVAANARHPYSNVDRSNDNGGDTGDSQVERLNQQQLDSVRSQSGTVYAAPPYGAQPYPGPGYAPPPPPPMMGAPLYQPRMGR